MPIIELKTTIHAPIELCFDMARDVTVHMDTVSHTRERVIEASGRFLNCGDIVTWEAVHFRIRQRLTAKITEMDRPNQFTDIQLKGAFHSFTHRHVFIEGKEGTIMKDIFEYRSPFGVIGKVADRLFLERYMRKFLATRAKALKEMAEGRMRNDQEKIWQQV